jgi:hypothetical protein
MNRRPQATAKKAANTKTARKVHAVPRITEEGDLYFTRPEASSKI